MQGEDDSKDEGGEGGIDGSGDGPGDGSEGEEMQAPDDADCDQ